MTEFFPVTVNIRLAPFWLPFGVRPGRDGVTVTDETFLATTPDSAEPRRRLGRRSLELGEHALAAVVVVPVDLAPVQVGAFRPAHHVQRVA